MTFCNHHHYSLKRAAALEKALRQAGALIERFYVFGRLAGGTVNVEATRGLVAVFHSKLRACS